MARPTKHTEEIADRLCAEIATGRSVKDLCDNETWTPPERTFYEWLWRVDGFSQKYARAKAAQQDSELERIIAIADGTTPEMVNVDRLRIDTRKWSMARLAPKKFGDRLALGGDKDMDPIQTEETGANLSRLLEMVTGIAERNRDTGDATEE